MDMVELLMGTCISLHQYVETFANASGPFLIMLMRVVGELATVPASSILWVIPSVEFKMSC